jgi:adenylosuccinate lyase
VLPLITTLWHYDLIANDLQVLSHEAAHVVKHEGLPNDLISRVRADPYFAPILDDLDGLLDAKTFIGRCPEQVDAFLKEWVGPALKQYEGVIGGSGKAELNV